MVAAWWRRWMAGFGGGDGGGRRRADRAWRRHRLAQLGTVTQGGGIGVVRAAELATENLSGYVAETADPG